MNPGDGLRIFLIVMGLAALVLANISTARRSMMVSFCAVWSVLAVLFILTGALLRPGQWDLYISWGVLLPVLFGIFLMLAVAYYFSLRVSQLLREARELAIQVSLLNQEIESIRRELSGGRADTETVTDEEDFVRD